MLTTVTTTPRRSLARVLDHLGDTLLQHVAGDISPRQRVSGVLIYDAADDAAIPPREIVLGVGVRQHDHICDVLRQLGRNNAAALVVRAPVVLTPEIEHIVERSDVALLQIDRNASWAQLVAMLRAVLGQDDTGEAEAEVLGGMPSGDLFSLANAIAALIDAPVTIEDRHSNVLAFSGRQDEADTARIETVLGRRVPDRYLTEQKARGEFELINRSTVPVFMEPWEVSGDEISVARVAMAVRAGEEVLGAIWAAVREPLSAERNEALADAAKLVALHMLRLRAGADVERRLRAELVSTVLEGGPGAAEAASRLGIIGHASVVLALAVQPSDNAVHGASATRVADLQRAADAFALHLTAFQPGSAIAVLGDLAYAVVPVQTDDGFDRVKRVADSFLERTAVTLRPVIGIGPLAADLPAVISSRRGADRAVRVLQSQRAVRRSATADEAHIDAILLELADMAPARGDTVWPPIARLLAYDDEHNSQLIVTLRCWLDAFGDVPLAAQAAYVHVNTFRYRLRRVAAVSGLDLSDAHDRFAAMLQLRLLDGRS